MIKIRIIHSMTQDFLGFHISGHAGYAASGKDIICAGVSALTYTFMNSCEALSQDDFVAELNDAEAVMKFRFRDIPSETGRLLFRSLLIGLESMEQDYGQKYLTVAHYQKLTTDGKLKRIKYQEV